MCLSRYVVLLVVLVLSPAQGQARWNGESPVEAPGMNLGDRWIFRAYHDVHGADEWRHEVVSVDPQGGFVIEITSSSKDRKYVPRYDGDHRPRWKNASPRLDFPLFVGKKWSAKYEGESVDGRKYTYQDSYEVLKFENVGTQAGEFRAVKIRRINRILMHAGFPGRETFWYAPDVKTIVKSSPSWLHGRDTELLSYALAETPGGASRSAEGELGRLRVREMTFTSDVRGGRPVDDLSESTAAEKLFVHAGWYFPGRVSESVYVSFRILDGAGMEVPSYEQVVMPSDASWYTWTHFLLEDQYAKGEWKAVVEINGRKIGEKSINIR